MSTLAGDDDAIARRRRAKNIAVGATVAGFCVLFFLITVVRMGMR
jgi:hypothetical protein